MKRFLSGQINSEAILAACERYHPEQVLLPNHPTSADWKKFLDTDYSLVCADKTSLLYVARTLVPPASRR